MCNKKEKEKRIRDTAERLFRKRYEGMVEQEPMYPRFIKDDKEYGDNECQQEYGKFADTFIGNIPRPKEIFFTENLLNELKEIAEESNVEISTLINCYLLQMLERNKRTTEHTKARKIYVKNSLYATSLYIRRCETIEAFEKRIFDKDFINYKELSYKNIDWDEEVYIKNFLLNNGYTLKQIHEIEKEEKEIQGTFSSPEGEIMNPKVFNMELVFKEVPTLNFDYTVYLFIPARLGLHYILLNKSKTLKSYKDIEKYLISKLKEDENIWDLYKDYLVKNPM